MKKLLALLLLPALAFGAEVGDNIVVGEIDGSGNPVRLTSSESLGNLSATTTDAAITIGSGAGTNNRLFDFLNSSDTFRIGAEYDNTNINLSVVDRSRELLFTVREGGFFGFNLGTDANPTGDFDIRAFDEGTIDWRMHTASSTAGDQPLLRFMRRRGTMASPSDTTNGDDLGSVQWYNYDSANVLMGQLLVEVADQTTYETRLRYYGRDDGSFIEQLRIEENLFHFMGQINPIIHISEGSVVSPASNGALSLQHGGGGTSVITARTGSSGSNANLDINATIDDGVSGASVRFHRSTNTTGAVQVQFLRGNGGATVDHRFFGTDSGTAAELARNGGGVRVGGTDSTDALLVAQKILTADDAATSTSMVSSDLSFAAEASTTYAITVNLFFDGDAANDLEVDFSLPSGSTGRYTVVDLDSAPHSTVAATTDTSLQTSGSGTVEFVLIKAFVEVSVTAGDITLRFGKFANNTGTDTVIHAGSTLVAYGHD